jgi:hypothetical protein
MTDATPKLHFSRNFLQIITFSAHHGALQKMGVYA